MTKTISIPVPLRQANELHKLARYAARTIDPRYLVTCILEYYVSSSAGKKKMTTLLKRTTSGEAITRMQVSVNPSSRVDTFLRELGVTPEEAILKILTQPSDELRSVVDSAIAVARSLVGSDVSQVMLQEIPDNTYSTLDLARRTGYTREYLYSLMRRGVYQADYTLYARGQDGRAYYRFTEKGLREAVKAVRAWSKTTGRGRGRTLGFNRPQKDEYSPAVDFPAPRPAGIAVAAEDIGDAADTEVMDVLTKLVNVVGELREAMVELRENDKARSAELAYLRETLPSAGAARQRGNPPSDRLRELSLKL